MSDLDHHRAFASTGERAAGLALLIVALVFGALAFAAESRINRLPPNDLAFHLAATERLLQSLERGEPFLDPWVSEWALGYPVWRSYQPLPHLLGALVLKVTQPFAGHATAFASLTYALLLLLPLSVYVGARELGLAPVAAGLASLLVLAPSATGEFGRYHLGFGSTVWRGSGLYTQLVAMHLLILALGQVRHALDTGKRRLLAATLVALTALSHLVFGYVAVLSAAVLAVLGPPRERCQRLVRLATVWAGALALLAWLAVPLLLARHEVNHSRWEHEYKWDSFGPAPILRELGSGALLDSGRPPLLSLLVAAGVLAAAFSLRAPLPQRLLGLTLFWLALFFGRRGWGHLLLLLAVPSDLHLHRLEAAFELSAVLLAAWGVEWSIARLKARSRGLAATAMVVVAVALVVLGRDRARYLQESALWGEENLASYERERADVEASLADVRAIIAENPGRVSAGLVATWARSLKVGSIPFYEFLTLAHLDEASFLYHSMSLTSEVMTLRDEGDRAHDVAFGVRAVVAPADRTMPAHLRKRSVHGRIAVYESSPEGYFGLVDIGGTSIGGRGSEYDVSAAWLKSPHLRQGIVFALDPKAHLGPTFSPAQAFPPIPESLRLNQGRILSQTHEGETYRARLALPRPCYALVKMTWHPDLVATVDDRPAAVVRVTPGFAAVPVPQGDHEVVVRYAPGPLRLLLLLAGVAFVVAVHRLLRRPAARVAEARAAARLLRAGEFLQRPRVAAALVVAAMAILALRPLFRAKLVGGHDATEYPGRLVEMARVLGEGQVPPVWAPDLGAGHGQPLFEFAPPLVYLAALPGRALGLRLSESLQFGLLGLCAAGAAAMYRMARRAEAGRRVALAVTAAWLFSPYLALDLFVRSAFAEASAVAVAPVALMCVLRVLDGPTPSRVAAAGAACALLPLAHNAAALLLFPALALLVLVRSLTAAARVRAGLAGGSALLLGLALSAYFWVPALLEKDLVKTDLLRQGFLDWRNHAIAPWQLLWSPWGHGVSVAGTSDGMSFQLGLLHLALGVAGAFLALRSGAGRRRAEGMAFAVSAVAGAWLATTLSAPLWARVPTLQYLAYPWRALLLPGLFLPLMALPALARLPRPALAGVTALLVLVNLPHTEPKDYFHFDEAYYAERSIAEKGLNTSTREEYEPRWVARRPPFQKERLTGVDGRIEVREQSVRGTREDLWVRAEGERRVETARFYYPESVVRVDGAEVAIEPVPERGTMSFHVPAGAHSVAIELRPTRVRANATLLSILAALALVGLAGVRPSSRGAPGIREANDRGARR